MHVFSTFFNNRSKTCRWNDAKCLFMWYFTCKAGKFIIYCDFNLISKKSKIAAKMATIRELMIDKFSGNGNFNRTWHHDLGDIAHARRRETGLFGVVAETWVFKFHFNQVCCVLSNQNFAGYRSLIVLVFFESHFKHDFQALLSKLTSL